MVDRSNNSCIVLNIPHSSMNISDKYKNNILLSDDKLKKELDLLTDIDVDKIFTGYDRVVAEYSRLVCDLERFLDDEQEEMSKIGMGVVYTRTCNGEKLREADAEQRKEIIEKLYIPYHTQLENLVSMKLEKYDKCLVVDCHSYSEELPYITGGDVDICIGIDEYHTKDGTWKLLSDILIDKGYKVEINKPFSGSIVPLEYYMNDRRVSSIMIEINKRIYTHDGESTIEKLKELSDLFSGILPELEKTV